MQTEELYSQFRKCGYNVAENYRERARSIIEILLRNAKALAAPENWQNPSDELMEKFIDEFPGILNWALKGHGKTYSNLPLTEEQMSEIEQTIAINKEIFGWLLEAVFTDD